MLIGLNGRIGAGKDTVGTYLVDNYGFERRSYAAKLKEATAALFGISVEYLEFLKEKGDAAYVLGFDGRYRPEINLSIRQILQRMGTEVGRDIFGEDFWVDQLFSADTTSADFDFRNIVITDCRFVNEAERIRRMNGRVICIERGESKDPHRSENKLPANLIDDYILNFKTLEYLYNAVDARMYAYGIDKVTNAT